MRKNLKKKYLKKKYLMKKCLMIKWVALRSKKEDQDKHHGEQWSGRECRQDVDACS